MRLAVIMSIQDKLICVHLVMSRCMFSMQLFLSEIVKFCFDRKYRAACINLSSSIFNTRATNLLHLMQAQNIHAAVELAARRSVCSMQLFCQTGQSGGNRAVGEWSDKAVGHLSGVWGSLSLISMKTLFVLFR